MSHPPHLRVRVDVARAADAAAGGLTLCNVPPGARLEVRYRRPGDRFWPPWRPSPVKLKDFLRGRGVPLHLRDVQPLLCVTGPDAARGGGAGALSDPHLGTDGGTSDSGDECDSDEHGGTAEPWDGGCGGGAAALPPASEPHGGPPAVRRAEREEAAGADGRDSGTIAAVYPEQVAKGFEVDCTGLPPITVILQPVDRDVQP